MSEKCEHTCGAAGGCIICGENMLTAEIVQNLEAKLSELATLSLSYKRVCEVLGVKKDVIGYVDKLKAQLAKLQWVKITPETMPEEGEKVDILLDIDGLLRVCDFVWEKSKMESAFMPHPIVYYMHQPPLPDKEKP